jgi:hypothetical protein
MSTHLHHTPPDDELYPLQSSRMAFSQDPLTPAAPRPKRRLASPLAIAAAAILGASASDSGMRDVRTGLRRRVSSARELHEAADMAERGEPLPGTRAAVLLAEAKREGDFKVANQIIAWIKEQAPELRERAAAEADRERRHGQTMEQRVARQDRRLTKAADKRARKAAARQRPVAPVPAADAPEPLDAPTTLANHDQAWSLDAPPAAEQREWTDHCARAVAAEGPADVERVEP